METWQEKGRVIGGGKEEEGTRKEEDEGVGAEDGDFKSPNGFGTDCLRANTLLEYSFHLETELFLRLCFQDSPENSSIPKEF